MAAPALDIELLRTFQTIVETGGFTRAAERLCRTQSTVSLQLKKLEDSLGKQLIERGGRRFALTEEGELLRIYARRILQLSAEAQALLSHPPVTGRIALGVPEDFATRSLPLVLRRFARVYPAVHIEVRCSVASDLLQRLADGELDLVLARREPGVEGGEPLLEEELVWAAAQGFERDVNEPLPLVLFGEGCFYRPTVLSKLQQMGRPWRLVFSSGNLAGVHAAVLAGLGLTVLPQSALLPNLRQLHGDEALPAIGKTEIAFFQREGPKSEAATTLLEFIRRSLTVKAPLDSVTCSLPPHGGPQHVHAVPSATIAPTLLTSASSRLRESS